jgi:enoyl-CoA hydratase/carnithine racemase
MGRAANVSRRSPLLTGLVGLCLIVLAGLPATATRHTALGAADAVVAAIADVDAAARTVPERLAPAHRSGLDRHLPASAALPAAAVLAFLLAARGRRDDTVSTTPRPQLLRAAGRGPPVIS